MNKTLQQMQQELDEYIINVRDLRLHPKHLIANMILACHDEISEVYDAPSDVEEYIDVLHFVLSIANKFGIILLEHDSMLHTVRNTTIMTHIQNLRNALLSVTRFSKVFKHWSDKMPTESDMERVRTNLQIMYNIITDLCDRQGVSVKEEYLKKYEINIKRQQEGY